MMLVGHADQTPSPRVIVVGNEKGGSGKSTVAMHVAVGLMKSRQQVATIDLGSREKTFTHYIENRHAWAQLISCDLESRVLVYFVENMDHATAEDQASDGNDLRDAVNTLAGNS